MNDPKKAETTDTIRDILVTYIQSAVWFMEVLTDLSPDLSEKLQSLALKKRY